MELGARHCGKLIALFAVALMIPAVRGEACSCPGPAPPPSEARRLATAVFEGTIVDQRAVLINVYDMTYPAIDYEVTLTRVWKGALGRTVHVLRRGPCDPAFQVGTTYVIYADSDKWGRLLAAACTPTKPADDAARDVAELGGPFAVFERTTVGVPGSMPARRRVRTHIVAGLAVYGTMFLRWRSALVSRDALLSVETAWLAAVMVQAFLSVVCVVRRRSKLGALLLGAAVLTALFAIIWSGRRLLQNEWFSSFLVW